MSVHTSYPGAWLAAWIIADKRALCPDRGREGTGVQRGCVGYGFRRPTASGKTQHHAMGDFVSQDPSFIGAAVACSRAWGCACSHRRCHGVSVWGCKMPMANLPTASFTSDAIRCDHYGTTSRWL